MAFDLLAVAKDKNNKKVVWETTKNLNQIKSKPENTHKKNLRKQANKNRANKIGKHCPNHVQRE